MKEVSKNWNSPSEEFVGARFRLMHKVPVERWSVLLCSLFAIRFSSSCTVSKCSIIILIRYILYMKLRSQNTLLLFLWKGTRVLVCRFFFWMLILDLLLMQQVLEKAHFFIYYNYMGFFKINCSQPKSAVICRVGYLSYLPYTLWQKKRGNKISLSLPYSLCLCPDGVGHEYRLTFSGTKHYRKALTPWGHRA